MLASRRSGQTAGSGVSLRDTLIAAGLDTELVDQLDRMPHKVIQIDPRRPFREPGVPRDEVLFVRSGLISKFKVDSAGRRQIVALRFPGEGILPRKGDAGYGIQAITPSEAGVPRSGALTQRSASERLWLTISEIILRLACFVRKWRR